MKRTLISLIIALLVIAICLGVYLYTCDNTLDLYVEIPPEADGYEISLRPTGIIEFSGYEQISAEKARISFKGFIPGETKAVLKWNGLAEDSFYASEIEADMRLNSIGIITDELTGNFSGWTGVCIAVSVALITSSVILFLAFRRAVREDMYSYKTISYLGFSLFLLIVGLIRSRYIIDSFFHPENHNMITMLIGYAVSARSFMLYTAPITGLFAIALCISNVSLMKHEGVRHANMLGIIVGLVMIIGAVIGIVLSYSRVIFEYKNLICNVYSGVFCYFECLLFATIMCGIAAAKHEPELDKDYVVVLGCAIRPDGSLLPIVRGRVERAMAFVKKQLETTGKKAILLPSGGKGSDEIMAESEAMAMYMREHGIPDDEILIENQSTTTRENMMFSRGIVDKLMKNAKVAFSTTSYHVFRSGILAKGIGWDIEGMGCPTKWYFWPNAFLREFVALLVNSIPQQVVVLAIICAVSVGLSTIMSF